MSLRSGIEGMFTDDTVLKTVGCCDSCNPFGVDLKELYGKV